MCSAQTLCKESYVEACVAFLEELDEARIADRSGGADRIDVEIVAGVAPGVQGAQFVADGVLKCQERGPTSRRTGVWARQSIARSTLSGTPCGGVTESWAKEGLTRSMVTSSRWQ